MARRRRTGRPAKLLAFAGLLAAAAYLFYLPDPAPLKRAAPKTTAYIELRKRQAAAKGRKLRLRWTWIAWSAVSPHLKNAVRVAEDSAFYRHSGVDWEAVRLAAEKDWAKRRFAHGASTITQQLARNLYLSPSKNPLRKLKELLIARRLERVLGKRRIFELYLNIAEWGPGVFGCEAAARHHFGKSAAELNLDEAVALAVVLPNPLRFDPVKKGRYVERNMRRVLRHMRSAGLVPPEPEPLPSEEELAEALEPAPVALSEELPAEAFEAPFGLQQPPAGP